MLTHSVNMDVLQREYSLVKDEVGDRCQVLFGNYLKISTYQRACIEIASHTYLCTLQVKFTDIQVFSSALATTIADEYYRVYPYLCQAVTNYVRDITNLRKQCYLALTDVPMRLNIWELKPSKKGSLIRISAHVVRTGDVQPELVLGTFDCMQCGTEIRNVEQEFKYTHPKKCSNPLCDNRRKFELNIEKSTFVDFQRVTVQETQTESSRGRVLRGIEVILRHEIVDAVLPGGVYDFIGTLIVIPNVGSIQLPGAKVSLYYFLNKI